MRDRLRSLDQNCGTAASPQRPASIPPLRAAARACRLALAGIVTLALSALIGAEARAADMVLPGSFDVSPQGSATYTIPIEVPPGTAGMVPALTLQYDSGGGNGIMGMGWSLGGLPSIARCPRTLAQDGVRGGVNYNMDDRYCLGDQRLVLVAGTYGSDGSEYRTEIDSYTRVIAHGVAVNGPAWFEARTKAGQIMRFGYTADSQIPVSGNGTRRAWI